MEAELNASANPFAQLGLQEELLQSLAALGFESPTPIQMEAIPEILNQERDLIGLAQTGTGKTAAFSLPLLQQADPQARHPQALLLSPTRELCIQITQDIENYARFMPSLSVVPVYGGASMDTQIRKLKRGAQFVVGTPGRVLDLIRRDKLDLENIRWVVLDEADEMLNMGFREELDAILEATPEQRRTLLFSATMPAEIRNMVHRYMTDPAQVSAGKQNVGADTVTHRYYVTAEKHRYAALQRLADALPDIFAIVFCRTRQDTRDVAEQLMRDGYPADALHGDLTQSQRDRVMDRFRRRDLQLLVATDVAARGLDVRDVTHVINYHLPDDNESYIHRSGRTGRAGRSGESIALITPRESFRIRQIEKRSGISFEHAELPSEDEVFQRRSQQLAREVRDAAILDDPTLANHRHNLEAELADMSKEELVRALAARELAPLAARYQGAPKLDLSPRRQPDSDRTGGGNRDFRKFFINLGERDQLTKGELMNLINQNRSLKKASIGKIEIQRNFSFFEIERRFEEQVVELMSGSEYRGQSIQVEAKSTRNGYVNKGKPKRKPPRN